MVGGSNSTEGFERRALVESGNGILNRTKLRFVTRNRRAVRGVNGLAMNGLAKPARPPLTPVPARKTWSVS